MVDDISPDMTLFQISCSAHGCYSVKCGCETTNCGLCTVFLDEKPVLSCAVLAARADGHKVETMEGLQKEAEEFGRFIADQGAEQCGFCNPGMIMNAIALFRENRRTDRRRDQTVIWQETSAAVPDMKDSSGEFMHLWNIGKNGGATCGEVGKRVRKKDAMAMVTGQPVYTDDLAPKECLIVKVLRSPHANAIVEEVNKTVATESSGC